MDPYERIAAFYDCEHAGFRDDIEFYLQALPGGSVLEIGAGTGRIAGELASAGLHVCAVDPSEAMLSRARRRWGSRPNLSFQHGSLPAELPAGTFDAVILSLNTLWHLDDAGRQLASLKSVRSRLRPGGMLFVDLTNPLSMADRGAQGEIRERFRGVCGQGELTVQSAAWDDEAEQQLLLHLTYDCVSEGPTLQRTLATLSLRYVYRSELELMLGSCGFLVRAVFGDYDTSPYTAVSPNILSVAAMP
jgi:SAM-dependent methyltransferase